MIQPDKDFHYGFYCVAFLDVLGQRRKLRELPRIPKKDGETTRLLAETAGHVLRLRKNLVDCFEQFQMPTQVLVGLPNDAKERIEKAKQSVRYRGFSDLIIMEISFRDDEEQCAPMIGVYGCIAACCILHGAALSSKRPIRGGIDVGLGLDLTEDEVYGPVLEHAHRLESELADYPRVLVGEGLSNYLDVVERQIPKTIMGRLAQTLASQCKRFITLDSDGLQILDFLGEEMAKLLTPAEREELFKLIGEYVAEQKEIASARNDHKHLSRYLKLGAYIEKRSALWKNG